MVRRHIIIPSAKLLRHSLRIAGGHGSALPGRIIEKIDPRFLKHMLAPLPKGVVIVTGTNGKTTTTHMLVHLLRAQGLKVLTNPSGSNLTRGLISTIVEQSTATGKLPYDIAVFELDEAYAPLLATAVPPKIVLALNVMRDQLDRYGELDTTATLIAKAAAKAEMVIVNGNDALLLNKTKDHPQRYTFGLADGLLSQLSSEANLYGKQNSTNTPKIELNAKITSVSSSEEDMNYTVEVNDKVVKNTVPLLGIHNVMNGVAAVFTTSIITSNNDIATTSAGLKSFHPAFGRGETLRLDNKELTVALVKNPSGFTQNLATFVTPNIDAILVVINDEYADGRDVSWLWDVQIERLRKFKGTIFVGGKRRFDMALRLKYEDIAFKVIDTDNIEGLMKQVMQSKEWDGRLLIIPTYTAMLAIRKWLGAKLGGRHIW